MSTELAQQEEPRVRMDSAPPLLFMENEHYALVDALPYIDTQLGQVEVAQQVKALIDEEMGNFEPRDYLASLPLPEFPHLETPLLAHELARIEQQQPLEGGVDLTRPKSQRPTGAAENDPAAWIAAGDALKAEMAYHRLRTTNLEMLDHWGNKAWIAHSTILRASERVLSNEVAVLRDEREEVNKRRKLDQISCGNELRKSGRELEEFMQDNHQVGQGLQTLEVEVMRLRNACADRGVTIDNKLLEACGIPTIGEDSMPEAEPMTDRERKILEAGGKVQKK